MSGPEGEERRGTSVRLDVLVPAEFNGERIDRAAAKLCAAQAETVSRSELSRWIKAGQVTLNGRVVKPKTVVAAGERIVVDAVRKPRFDWSAAQDVDFGVVYEDASLIVVEKAAGVVVHPGAGNARGTLVNGLLKHRPALASLPRAGLIHRLDKDTSGLLLVAAELDSLFHLREAMAERRIERRYLAIAEGRMIADQRIDMALGRDPRNRLRQAVRKDGREAVTQIVVRQRWPAHTLVEARLETGRTHQIRAHLAAVGHPLVGDRRYGARGIVARTATDEAATVVRSFGRQALHACKLAFAHPLSGEPLAFESPLPADMEQLLRSLAAAPGTLPA